METFSDETFRVTSVSVFYWRLFTSYKVEFNKVIHVVVELSKGIDTKVKYDGQCAHELFFFQIEVSNE